VRCLVTGAAGFIGSHLAERLVKIGHDVVGIDSFITGTPYNVEPILASLPGKFVFSQVDLADIDASEELIAGGRFDVIFHNAALGSVPRSRKEPHLYITNNVIATRHLFLSALDHKVPRVVYASSSSVYGNIEDTLKAEDRMGRPLSPYAVSKRLNELDAEICAAAGGETTLVGLRYFNVFGPRQRVGPYAAVVPEWLDCIKTGRQAVMNGWVEITRDFTYVDNVTYANLLAADAKLDTQHEVFNIGAGEQVSLGGMWNEICVHAVKMGYKVAPLEHRSMREGDIRVSGADITKAKQLLGYEPTHNWRQGVELTCESVL